MWLCSNKEFKDIKASNLFQCWEGGMMSSSSSRKNNLDWAPPPSGTLKFNVDGASRGKSGLAGIGGVLRDHSGSISVVFS